MKVKGRSVPPASYFAKFTCTLPCSRLRNLASSSKGDRCSIADLDRDEVEASEAHKLCENEGVEGGVSSSSDDGEGESVYDGASKMRGGVRDILCERVFHPNSICIDAWHDKGTVARGREEPLRGRRSLL